MWKEAERALTGDIVGTSSRSSCHYMGRRARGIWPAAVVTTGSISVDLLVWKGGRKLTSSSGRGFLESGNVGNLGVKDREIGKGIPPPKKTHFIFSLLFTYGVNYFL